MNDFVDTCTELAGTSDFSLDGLLESLRAHSATHGFDDDCCLVELNF